MRQLIWLRSDLRLHDNTCSARRRASKPEAGARPASLICMPMVPPV